MAQLNRVMESRPTLRKFDSNEDMQQELAAAIASDIRVAIESEGDARFVVSGGNTPKRLFEILCHYPLNWEKVTILLADDRWLARDHADSNEYLVRNYLLKSEAKRARFVGLKSDGESATAGATITNKILEDALKKPIDVLILGMGTDGHTASLFPCSDQLEEALFESQLKVRAVTPKTASYERITMTLPTLLNSKRIYLQLSGQGKLEIFNKASEAGRDKEMPIRFFIRQDTVPMTAFWAP